MLRLEAKTAMTAHTSAGMVKTDRMKIPMESQIPVHFRSYCYLFVHQAARQSLLHHLPYGYNPLKKEIGIQV